MADGGGDEYCCLRSGIYGIRYIGYGVERGTLGSGNIDGMDLIGDLEFNNVV